MLPFYRLFTVDHLVHPENGPASKELARAVESELLTQEPYSSYHIDLDRFFSSGTDRVWGDVLVLSDRKWGWDSDYAQLREVSREAIWMHPGPYIRSVVLTFGGFFLRNRLIAVDDQPREAVETAPTTEVQSSVPPPSEGQLVPSSRVFWLASGPEGRALPGEREQELIRKTEAVTSMSIGLIRHYRIPFDPIFVSFGIAAFRGRGRPHAKG